MQKDLPDLYRLVYDKVVKLEITSGVPTWEAFPGVLHQETIDAIRASIEPTTRGDEECGCYHYPDILIRFPDGSSKRPDISIFCHRLSRNNNAVTIVPEAVVEIVSPGYEYKDLSLNPPFYLSQGVRDIIIFDPSANVVCHHRESSEVRYVAPVLIELQCGCQFTVPYLEEIEG